MRKACLCVPVVVVLASALQGCSMSPRDSRAAYEPVADRSTSALPMAQLPAAAGDTISVLQSRVDGVLVQRIVLRGDTATAGENEIVVKVDQNDRRPGDIDGPVPKPTESIIRHELDGAFGDIDMQMSLTWNRNSFGPFGYAIGHAPQGVTCIYAWQFSMGRPMHIIDDPAAVASASSMPSAPTSVRVRLCKAGMGEEDIVGMIRALAVYPPGSTAPYVDPAYEAAGPLGAHDALSAAGVPGGFFLSPSHAASDENPRKGHGKGRVKVAHHRHHRRSDLADAPAPMAPVTGVNVPLPAGGPAPVASAVNPLLAPLQDVLKPRATTAANDMPLPGHAPKVASPGAPAAVAPQPAPMPLPN